MNKRLDKKVGNQKDLTQRNVYFLHKPIILSSKTRRVLVSKIDGQCQDNLVDIKKI